MKFELTINLDNEIFEGVESGDRRELSEAIKDIAWQILEYDQRTSKRYIDLNGEDAGAWAFNLCEQITHHESGLEFDYNGD